MPTWLKAQPQCVLLIQSWGLRCVICRKEVCPLHRVWHSPNNVSYFQWSSVMIPPLECKSLQAYRWGCIFRQKYRKRGSDSHYYIFNYIQFRPTLEMLVQGRDPWHLDFPPICMLQPAMWFDSSYKKNRQRGKGPFNRRSHTIAAAHTSIQFSNSLEGDMSRTRAKPDNPRSRCSWHYDFFQGRLSTHTIMALIESD